MTKESIAAWFRALQDSISSGLETLDGHAEFKEDKWNRSGGGGGRSRAIQNGAVFEKGGVNFSAVHGSTPDNILKALNLPKSDFYATGVSLVIHPENPWVPIIHMNVRYFEMSNGVYWFGGGIDLTPHFAIDEDARFFHQELKRVCDAHSGTYYPKFKAWADDYFFIAHRQETRGVGGIFFDRLSGENEQEKEQLWSFVQDVGNAFLPVYSNLVERNRNKSFGEKEKQFQLLRRGRYVEFNLVYDKGTKFGLDTDGRTESILMSMPPHADWVYDYQPMPGIETETLGKLKKGIEWA